jgi:hypothetical protein
MRVSRFVLLSIALCGASSVGVFAVAQAALTPIEVNIEVKIDDRSKPISPDLFGIFFEDLSYAADGGLYAEQVQPAIVLRFPEGDSATCGTFIPELRRVRIAQA